MNIKDILLAPRYGIYRPGTGTVDFELTSYGSGFKLSTSMEVQEGTYEEVGKKIKNYLDNAKKYTSENDLALLGYLVKGLEVGSTHIIKFDNKGITLASLITVDARKVQFIYEKYSSTEYALQLALTKGSSIKFAWTDSKLTGDFYFNIKRSGTENITTVTGYVDFRIDKDGKAIPVVMSAGVVKRKFITDPNKETEDKENKGNIDTNTASKVEDHTYVQLRSRSANGITVSDIISMFTPSKAEIPDVLDKVSFYDFAILTRTQKEGENKTSDFAIVIDCKITIKDKPLRTKLTIHTTKEESSEAKAQSFSFSALVTVDEHQFQLRFAKSSATQGEDKKSAWSILASYANEGSVTLDIQKMIVSLFGADETIPELKINLNKPKVFFFYQRSTDSSSGDKNKPTGKFLFGAGASIGLDVKELPIAGSVLIEMKALEFDDVLFIYSSGAISKADLKPLSDNKILDKDFEARAGLSLSAGIVIDGKKEFYTFGGQIEQKSEDTKDKEPKDVTPTSLNEVAVKGDLPAATSSDAKWYIIDKKLGPVNFQRLGLKYHDGRAYILLDASIKTSSFSLQMMGLGLGFKPDWDHIDPSFHLKGLGLSYKTDTVEISGAFLRGQQTMMINGQSQTIDTYNGAAMIRMKKFTISAIGSYAEYMDMNEKKTSLFVYGVFLGNIGGPPIFQVTGIAAGFGYNRKINAPEIDEVATYPLVALAMSGENRSLGDVLSSLETPMSNGKLPIEISPGNYWLALGVKFTSFKIIESFVLVTVNFGDQTEFNILGLSRLSFPEKSFRDKFKMAEPIIYIELAIKISYTVGGELFKVDGRITPESYLFSKNCRLTGGFAFYVWVAGPHAGDFVLTLGGYFPGKQMPAHYPQVPRIQLLWQLSESVMIVGQLYFALTPSSIMMGGRWELHVVTKNVKVAVIMWLDILLEWAPFYYEISMGLIFRIEAHIPMKLCTIHLNIELRAQLDLWGPDFSGKAVLDLGIISFETSFGKAVRGGKKSIGFDDFAQQFLPKSKDKSDSYDTISITPDGGVINIIEKEKGDKYYVVNPLQASINIDSNVPITQASVNDQSNELQDYIAVHKIGIKPCGLGAPPPANTAETADANGYRMTDSGSASVELIMSVSINYNGTKTNNFKQAVNTKSYPKALWSHPGLESDDKVTMIEDIPSGFQLTPSSGPKVSELKEYDFSTFKEDWQYEGKGQVVLKKLESNESNDFNGEKYEDKVVSDLRNKLAKEACALFFDDKSYQIDTEDINTILTQGKDQYFRSLPKPCSIGKVPHKFFTS